MEQIIARCTETVDDVSKKEIPKGVWKACAGVAILNITDRGLIISVGDGDGVVIKHNKEDNTWGAPSCLMFTSASGGAIIGKAQKKLVLFPMTDYGLKQLTANTKYQLGGQLGLAAGPVGRDFAAGVDAGGHGVNVTLSYVFSEGALLDVGITNNFIDNVSELNEAFYGKKATPNEIVFDGAVDIPKGKGVEELQAKLAEICN